MVTAWVDLSDVCRAPGGMDWGRYVRLRHALRAQVDGVRALGDNLLLQRLPAADRSHLQAAVRHGEVELVPYAAPHLAERVLEGRATVLVSNDTFALLRPLLPELDGFDRVLAHRLDDAGAQLTPGRLSPLDPERAHAVGDADLAAIGYRTPGDRKLLRWDWRCRSTDCPAAHTPQLESPPVPAGDGADCPDCGRRLVRLGAVSDGVEVALAVGGQVRQRVAIAAGLSLTVGKGVAPGDIDVGPLLRDAEAVHLLTREHLVVTNRDGRLRARGTAPRGGNRLQRADGTSSEVDRTTPVEVGPTDAIWLADAVEMRPSARRWTRSAVLARTTTLATAGA